MVSVLISRLVLLVFGTLYPAYASYKTVKTKNVRDYVRWMIYWIVFAVYTFVEIFADIFVSFWCPFYYQLKIAFVFWLICPATRGSTYLFRKVINPQLSKHEKMLDAYIDSAWDQGYDIARKIGSHGVECFGQLILELLRKGQITAASFLPKNDYGAQANTVIHTTDSVLSAGNISDENALDDEDFAILMSENPELCKQAKKAATKQRHDEDYEPSKSDSDSEEEFTVRKRPLKVPVKKQQAKNMVLRERNRK